MGPDTDGASLTAAQRERLAILRSVESLADLAAVTGAATEHDAYFAAKEEWWELRGKELAEEPAPEGVPGNRVVVDGQPFVVHGITHADTAAEREYLREHVSDLLAGGAAVYCEQGIRPMYFSGFDGVCAMDDYRWAVQVCQRSEFETCLDDVSIGEFEGFVEDVQSLTVRLQDPVFSLIDSGREVYGEAFAAVLGDVASTLLTSHEAIATGEDFRSFAIAQEAAEDPSRLRELQHYYERRFLPQPVEREWLRRHDAELETVTHARNERMAEYAVYHAEGSDPVHLIVGAAHQPGVTYYLEAFRDGHKRLTEFDLVD